MSTFSDAPDGDSGKGAKIFKTKCAQCHVVSLILPMLICCTNFSEWSGLVLVKSYVSTYQRSNTESLEASILLQ